MSEQQNEAGAEQPQEGGQEQEQQQQEPKTFDAEYVEKLRKEAAQHRTEKNALAKQLEQQRTASMSEAEKAVAEAEQRGRTAAATEFGKRLARTEFDALAGRRNADFDTASALEYLDLGRFIGEDGEPDTKAIQGAVERLVPQPANAPPSFDGGSRTTPPKTEGMTQIIRRAAGRT